ncbi:hypothetical protein JMN23_22820 [Bacillus sp. RHFB]|nr:hypothetical protein [Bacillus sp. RHFB]
MHITNPNPEKLLQTKQKMQAVFKKKPHQFDHVIKMGEYKLQDAIPIRLGQEFETHRL